MLLELSRVEGVGERLVTVSPDVAVSTNLGGFVNKAGVWAPAQEPVYDEMEDSPLKWRVGPTGQHVEMGIAEMNLVLLLGQLGLTWDYQRERLLPIGTVYDPFVMRALEGIVYSTYSGSRFVLVGTPSGISLSREGGAHQSISTPGIGIETPGLTYAEPCYARELEWLLLDALDRLQREDGESLYLRLSTKPIDQAPFARLVEEVGRRPRAGSRRRRRLPSARGRAPRPRTASSSRRAARWCPRRSRPPTRSPRTKESRPRCRALQPRPSLPRVAAKPDRPAPGRAEHARATSSASFPRASASSRSSR